MIAFYLICVPVFFIVVLVKNRKEPGNPTFRARFGALVSPYRLKYFYWEMVLMVKRGLFIVINQTGYLSNNYAVRFSVSVCTIAVFGGFELITAPYNTKSSNLVNSTWNIILLVVLLCQGLVFEDELIGYAALGIFVILVVVSTLAIVCIWHFASLKTKNGMLFKPITISKYAFQKLPEDIQLEILYIFSEEYLNKIGHLNVRVSSKSKLLTMSDIRALSNVLRTSRWNRRGGSVLPSIDLLDSTVKLDSTRSNIKVSSTSGEPDVIVDGESESKTPVVVENLSEIDQFKQTIKSRIAQSSKIALFSPQSI
jgi:hypothetical protein